MRVRTGSSVRRAPPENRRISILPSCVPYLSFLVCLIGSMVPCMLFLMYPLMALFMALSLLPWTTLLRTYRETKQTTLSLRSRTMSEA